MKGLAFNVTFHGPFHIATGSAGHGADLTVDAGNLLPAASLKGLMRAATTNLLLIREPIIDEIFGARGQASPWSWSDAAFEDEPLIRQRSRIAIGDSGIVVDGALQRFDEVWAHGASFTIDQFEQLGPDRLDRDQLVLAAAASAVTSLGADRNRGFGWIGITSHPSDSIDMGTAVTAIEKLRIDHG